MKRDLELEEKKKTNEWDNNLDEVINFIKLATAGSYMDFKRSWTWLNNSRCKYVELRIDMRDGGFVLKDQDGNRISLKQFMYQYKMGDDKHEDFITRGSDE